MSIYNHNEDNNPNDVSTNCLFMPGQEDLI